MRDQIAAPLHRFVIAATLVALGLLIPVHAWTPLRPHVAEAVDTFCVLIGLPTDSFTYIPDPAEMDIPAATTQAVAVTVTYGTGFDPYPLARAAFQHAIDIWKTQLTSPIAVTVSANFSNLGAGVLGSAGFTAGYRDFQGVPMAATWFPVPIANKFYGSAIDPATPNISASFSSAFTNWYFGTDGLTPAGQYDFVSVVLHELGHGVGFAGSMGVTSGIGSWGRGSGYPYIYDRYVANGANQALTNTAIFANNSTALAAQLTSNNLFWAGAQGVAANAGAKPKLYAPFSWESGSSIAHLDDATFPAGNPNSLMTHAIGTAESIHNPGPITRGILADSGWTLGTPTCTYTLSATSIAVGQAGGANTVGVTAPAGCAWTAVSNSPSIATVTSGTPGSGNGVVGFTVSPNSSGVRSGTITVAGQTFTVNQGPIMTLDRLTLAYGAINTAGTLTNVTSPQTVRVAVAGGTPSWTAVTSDAWLQITGGAGTGNGQFTVSVVSSPVLNGLVGTFIGQVFVQSPGSANAPRIVTVRLTLFPNSTTNTAPFGSFDTPVAANGLQGSIAVTGWALDDTEVTRVEIWRDPVGAEPFYTGPGPGNGKVFIAIPTFVAGSRPDIETGYPNSPFTYRAGWGYLLLTWGLANQGNGTYTLYAFGYDADGHATTLGSKVIGVSNLTATKPFGAIDTPSYGQTISGGTFVNFGWALTPKPNTVDPRTCTIANGNVLVGIDSGPLNPVTYGGARTDIAAGFPGFSNSNNAGGFAMIEPSTLTNGTHSIGWLVTDSCGRSDGIGSRFFTVAGSSSVAPAITDAPPAVLTEAATTDLNWGAATVRRIDGDAAAVYPAVDGTRVVAAREMERVEVQLPLVPGTRYAGAQFVGGVARALPLGSSLDASTGTFYWQPAAGFLGSYDLQFVAAPVNNKGAGSLAAAGAAVKVRVVVGPPMRLAVDTPRSGAAIGQSFTIGGWAIDLAGAGGTGVDTVHVWAYPSAGGSPIFLGVADLGASRPDVAAIYGRSFERSAYHLSAHLPAGTYDVVVYAHRAATDAFDAAQSVHVTVQ